MSELGKQGSDLDGLDISDHFVDSKTVDRVKILPVGRKRSSEQLRVLKVLNGLSVKVGLDLAGSILVVLVSIVDDGISNLKIKYELYLNVDTNLL